MNRNVLFICCLVMLVPGKASADELRIAVASNFAPTLAVLAERFEKESGAQLTLIAGSTGKHYAQIRNGAPFDAFFAADRKRPELLEEQGIGLIDSRFTYARGRLVLWSRSAKIDPPFESALRTGKFGRLAIANPLLAPYGRAAKETLESLGLWEKLPGHLVRGENVAQAFNFIYSGSADAGLVALAQVKLAKLDAGHWIEVPRRHYSAIEQQAIAMNEAVYDFLEYVRGAQSRELILDRGYDLPR